MCIRDRWKAGKELDSALFSAGGQDKYSSRDPRQRPQEASLATRGSRPNNEAQRTRSKGRSTSAWGKGIRAGFRQKQLRLERQDQSKKEQGVEEDSKPREHETETMTQ